ncbi:Anthocyanidin 5,3-O-glucosyltransferase [Senna tora]|uniref:isoflavone 7-O-glucosyltransferase n=1 Tax=Senna tora TaxID=362788 RepID=A0A835CF11_9FABA|nr:Anthocyanidin 5,3-O-glucosyltransferase [Senna tora]
MQETIVLYPAPGIGHIISMVEFAKLLLHHHPNSFSITIILTTGFYHSSSVDSYIHTISQSYPSISFLRLPFVAIDSPSRPRSFLATNFEFIRLNTSHLASALTHISQTSNLRALVIDLFCTSAFSIATSLSLPVFYFFTSGAAILSFCCYFPKIHEQTDQNFKDLSVLLQIPGNPPLKSSHIVQPLLHRDDSAYWDVLYFFSHIPKSNGIIVNTFQELEPIAVKAITEGACFPDPKLAPPVFYIGPLIAESNDREEGGEERKSEEECLLWLEKQPSRSVVYLCFGSLGTLSAMQLKEIAEALERSGQRFLWVVKKPPLDESTKHTLDASAEFDLGSVLPSGFLKRTEERGMVVRSWAPQVEVLKRAAVGGFVTHCGWNSVLEAVVAGVPMIAWPLYAEQHMNRNALVEDMKMAIGLEQRDGDGFVSGDELEKRLRELMESEKGKEMRERSRKMREMAMSATSPSGSSTIALNKLVETWKGIGHITSMVEFAKLILHRHPHSFSITIILTTGFNHSSSVDSYIHRISQSHPSISFLRLPFVAIDSPSQPRSFMATNFEFIRLNTPHLASALTHISQTSNLRALIIDLFCTSALTIASSLSIPVFYFFTCGAAILSFSCYVPKIHEQTDKSFKDLSVLLHFPGNPPLKSFHMVRPMLDRDDPAYWDMLYFCSHLPKSNGIIVNTFQELEPIAVKAITEGACFPDPKLAPPVFYIGPLIAESNDRREEGRKSEEECLLWLEKQPSRSVVYLSFGSLGTFSVMQLKEIAEALERSGQRFLWVVKKPPLDESTKHTGDASAEFDLDSVLPSGFLERTEERGMVVRSWAPQVEVLNKEAVGGFVTHCGWNSVLEAVVAGVPMVAWPLYGEQHMNRNALMEDMEMAIGLEQRDGDGFVCGDELEKKLREVMELEKGKEMRERSWKMREMAMSATSPSGSSTEALKKLVQTWKATHE